MIIDFDELDALQEKLKATGNEMREYANYIKNTIIPEYNNINDPNNGNINTSRYALDGVKEGTKGLKLVTKGGKVLNIGKGVFGSIGLVGDVIGDMCDKNFDIRDYIEHGTDALGGIFGSIGDFTSDDFMGLIGGAIDWKGDHFWTSEDTKDGNQRLYRI